MKKLNTSALEKTQGGGINRDCTILGGLATVAVIGGIFVPSLFGTALTITAAAAVRGCF